MLHEFNQQHAQMVLIHVMCIIRGDRYLAAVIPIRTLALPSANKAITFSGSVREVIRYIYCFAANVKLASLCLSARVFIFSLSYVNRDCLFPRT